MTGKWQRDNECVGTELDNSFVILSVNTARYYAFNGPAIDIWDLLEQPRSCDEIIEVLLEKYDVTPEQCAQSVSRVVEELSNNGLVRLIG